MNLPADWPGWVIDLDDLDPRVPAGVIPPEWGWQGKTALARSWVELPASAVKYVRRVEELVGCSVALLSTSPEREDTILVHNPFEN